MPSVLRGYTAREMNALGSIGYSSYSLYTRDYEANLAHECATVSDTEAEAGLLQNESFRATAKDKNGEEKVVPFSTYVKRVQQFAGQVKKDAGAKDTPKSECPIDKARAESLTGMNAPLGWLMPDQMGGDAPGTPERQDFVGQPEFSLQDTGALVVMLDTPSIEPYSGGTLLSQEWLLTPCA